MSGMVLGTEGHRENGVQPAWTQRGVGQATCQQCDQGYGKDCIKALWAHRGRVTHGPDEFWGCAIRLAARISFLRHSKLTTGEGGLEA